MPSSVIVVGAGPVGLMHGLLERLVNNARVEIYEKRAGYSRSHSIKLDDDAMHELRGLSPALDTIIQQLRPHSSIRDIERTLSAAAARLDGIRVHYGREVAPGDLPGLAAQADKVIIAAGARSQGLAPAHLQETDNGGLLQVKFTGRQQRPPNKAALLLYNFLWYRNYTVFTPRSSVGDGRYQGQAFLSIQPNELVLLQQHDRFTYGRPGGVADLQNSPFPSLQSLGATVASVLESAQATEAQLITVDTKTYKRASVARGNVFHVGDAAAGLPYQQGLSMAYRVAPVLTRSPAAYQGRLDDLYAAYLETTEVKGAYIGLASYVHRNQLFVVALVLVVLIIVGVAYPYLIFSQ